LNLSIIAADFVPPESGGHTERSMAYADACASREILFREQELRALVIRRSVIRIDCASAVVMMMIIAIIFGISSLTPILIVPVLFAALVIASSTRSIAAALQTRQ
jgi:hypothetical protein